MHCLMTEELNKIAENAEDFVKKKKIMIVDNHIIGIDKIPYSLVLSTRTDTNNKHGNSANAEMKNRLRKKYLNNKNSNK